MKKKKVWIGLSGGVDSATSATLLKKAGYDVTGVFIKVWNPPGIECSWRGDQREAIKVALHLKIPFKTLDLSRVYKKEVIDYMLREYKAGRTPNPDVVCNREVKFGAFYRAAKKAGADYVATGHYAQTSNLKLLTSNDLEKDQTYFLWNLKQEQLPHILFPVGNLTKPKVRQLAKKFRLPNAKRKDSQGLCFIGKFNFQEFLRKYLKVKKGEVVDEKGKVIGEHDGVWFYTIGQRHGFTVQHRVLDSGPHYVVGKVVKKNILRVSQNPAQTATTETIKLKQVNWISKKPQINKKYSCRFRYRQKLVSCKLINSNKIKFAKPQTAVTPEQSLVLYDKEICLGGGVIN